MTVREYIGARYVPLFMGEWDNTKTYEPLSIVTNQGNSYTSRQFVPVGVVLTDETYWSETGNFNGQLEQYRQEVLGYVENVEDLSEVVTGINNQLKYKPYIVNLAEEDLQNVIDSIEDYGVIYCSGKAPIDSEYSFDDKDIVIINGSFEMNPRICTVQDYGLNVFFRINRSKLTLINCSFKATSYGQYPFIYARAGLDPGNGTDSNVECFSAKENSTINMLDCEIVNCMGGFINNSTAKFISNKFITSMAVYGNTSNVTFMNNAIEVQDSNIEMYYHVYYLDTNSVLDVINDSIAYYGATKYFDIIHSGVEAETAGLVAKLKNVSFFGNFSRFYQGDNVDLTTVNCKGMSVSPNVAWHLGQTINCDLNFYLTAPRYINFNGINWRSGYSIGSNGQPIVNEAQECSNDFMEIDFKYYMMPTYGSSSMFNKYREEGETFIIAWYDEEYTLINRIGSRIFSEIPAGAKYMKFARTYGTNQLLCVW